MQNNLIKYLEDIFSSNPMALIVFLLLMLSFIFTLYLFFRVQSLTKGSSGNSLEKIILDNKKRLKNIEDRYAKQALKISNIDSRIKTSVRGVALERFDPFQQQGGQQSFSSAFIDESGDGVILSGIHSRDGVRVYAKEVKNFTSQIELSEEEARAVKKAQNNLS